MNATAIQECESVSRAIARWGSVAAAAIFGIGFLTDEALSYHLVTGNVLQISFILLIFAGYLLAWCNTFEVLGSTLAIAAAFACWIWCQMQCAGSLRPIFFAVAGPALFHLLAVAFHQLRPLSGYRWSSGGISDVC